MTVAGKGDLNRVILAHKATEKLFLLCLARDGLSKWEFLHPVSGTFRSEFKF